MKPLVLVVWNDAHGSGTESYDEDHIPHQPLQVTTVGWLMRDDETGVSICNESVADGDWRGHTFVPRPMVVSVTPVKKGRKRVPPCSVSVPSPSESS